MVLDSRLQERDRQNNDSHWRSGMTARYWKADPHQWGPGQTHIIDGDERKTLCGKLLSECPGRPVSTNEYSCRACAKVLESRQNCEKRKQEWESRQQEYEAQRAEQNREWWEWYNGYLQSSKWAWRRAAVLKRAGSLCEARLPRCTLRATQVHHTTYEHVGNEPLFDLRAVCEECHQSLTEQDRFHQGRADRPPPEK